MPAWSGTVGAAGFCRCAARGQGCAAQMVAVQVEEYAAPLDRNAQAAEAEYCPGNSLPKSYSLLWLLAPGICAEKRFYFNRLNRARPRPENTQPPSMYRRQVSIGIHVAHHLFRGTWSDDK